MLLDLVQEMIVRRRNIKHLLVLAFFLLSATLIFWRYLEAPYQVGTDAMGMPVDLAMRSSDGLYFSSWRAFTSLGHLNYPSPVMSGVEYVLMEVVGLSPLFISKAVVVLSFIVSGLAMYLCAWKLVGGFVGSFTASIIYAFNQVFLSQVTEVHHYFLLGYAMIPLLFLLFYQALKLLDWKRAALLPAASVAFGTVAAPNLVLITAIFLFLFSTVYIFMRPRTSWKGIMVMTVICVVCVGAILLPTVLMKFTDGGSSYLSIAYTLDDARSYSSPSILHALGLGATENAFISNTPGGQWTFPAVLWPLGMAVALVIPLVALQSIKLRRTDRMVLPLLVPAILFVIIAQASTFPTSLAFEWAFMNVPYVDSIRVFTRFLLLTGLAFALLVAIVLKDFDRFKVQRKPSSGPVRRATAWLTRDKRVVAIIIVLAMLWPSSAVFTGEIRGFDLPSSYAEPYEWLGERSGDFRVLSLPWGNIYYDSSRRHIDGYPSTPTLDVSIYSPMISNKAGAYGLETSDFWTFIAAAVKAEQYGYKDIPALLGGAASVKYVVGQAYLDDNLVEQFLSMNGISVAASLPGGGVVLLNSDYEPRVHGLGSVALSSGTRMIIPTTMGLGLVDYRTSGLFLIDQLPEGTELTQIMDMADRIIVSEGDVLNFMVETTSWKKGQNIDLLSFVDEHLNDQGTSWVVSNGEYMRGYAHGAAVACSGLAPLYVPTSVDGAGSYDLLLKVLYAPNAGQLDIRLDGDLIGSVEPYSDQVQFGWVRLTGLDLAAGRHLLALTNDGVGRSCIEQMLLVPHSEVDAKIEDTYSLLAEHGSKVTYVMTGSRTINWLPGTAFTWSGLEGNGASTYLYLDAGNVSGSARLIEDGSTAGGLARYANRIGQSLAVTEVLRTFIDGDRYTLNVTLKTSDAQLEEMVCRVEVWVPGEEYPAARLDLRGTDFDASSAYQTFNIDLTAPVNTTKSGLQVRVMTASERANMSFGSLSLAHLEPVYPTTKLDIPFGGDYSLVLARGESPDGSFADGAIVVDGVRYQAVADQPNGRLRFDLSGLSKGQHVVEVEFPYVYAMSLGLQGADPVESPAQVTYERVSSVEYRVDVVSDGPCWILLSESYNSLWTAEMDGQELMHLQVDSITNAYYVPEGGNSSVSITFKGQDAYADIVLRMSLATIGGTVLMLAVTSPLMLRKLKVR